MVLGGFGDFDRLDVASTGLLDVWFFCSSGKVGVFTLCIKVNWLLLVFLVGGWSLETSHSEMCAGGYASLLCCALV